MCFGTDQADAPTDLNKSIRALPVQPRFERMLFVCQRLGGEEGSGTSDAGPGANRSRLEKME